MRLDKLLTHLGVASRSGAREVLKAGRVRVNGEAVRDAAFQVEVDDRVPGICCCTSLPGC